MGDVDIVIPA
jgi:hypothetical protein